MSKELRVVLLGKTGAGKSSTGNTLLGRDAFRVARGLRSGTERCQWADEDKGDIILQITDTPGLCDTHRDHSEVLKEVGKSVAVARPGPHVILMVLRCDTRFTEEEFGAYLTLKALFGEIIKDYMIVVFVGADAYGDTLEKQRQGLEAEMRNATGHLREVLQDARSRFCGINNKTSRSDRERQATRLIDMMKDLMQRNDGGYFSDSLTAEVSDLVEPLVQRRMKGSKVSREAAERETKIAIVEEKEGGAFFETLMETITNKMLPAINQVAKAADAVTDAAFALLPLAKKLASPIAKKASQCSVM